MKSVLITGCNRGLGLGLTRLLLGADNAPKQIFAICRDEKRATDLKDLAQKHKNLKIIELDVTDFDSFVKFASKIDDIAEDDGIDLLINNAGYAPKSTRLNFVKATDFEQTFRINVTAPVLLTKALTPLLKKAATDSSPSWVINMSSVLGSITENTNGGLYPYRASKAALNACTKSMSLDLKNDHIHALCLHPGWVKTDMGGQNAQLEVEDACQQILNTVTNLTPAHNGRFFQYDGKELPW